MSECERSEYGCPRTSVGLGGDPASRSVVIQGRAVGAGRPVFVVAEAGVNHNGSLERALELVDAAAATGADAVKFQVFRANELVTCAAPTAAYQRAAAAAPTQHEMLRDLELDDDQLDRIAERCRQRAIIFLATPFQVEDVERVRRAGSAAIKIASTDLTSRPLLTAAAATQLPVILSTGAATRWEIGQSVGWLRQSCASNRLLLLHCVSCYPTPLECINLRAIAALRNAFDLPAGLSDHTEEVETGGWAVAAGACILEKHFTLDRTLPGPDHAMSLTPTELAEYVARARMAERALGCGRLGMQALEGEVRSVARKSVVAAVDIAVGTALTADLFTFKRPGTGITPGELPLLIGRHAVAPIPQDTVLSWDMVQ